MLQLLPAPPPPPEYCLFWADRWMIDPWWLCMQKAEWSGWAQFAGAMVAVTVAIAIPLVGARAAKAKDFYWAQALLMGLGTALADCVTACDRQNLDEVTSARTQLGRAVDDFAGLQFSSLSHEQWSLIFALRNRCADVLSRSAGLAVNANWLHWSNEFDSIGTVLGAVGRQRFKLK